MLRARGWLWLLALSVGCVFFGVPAMAQGQPEEEAHGIFARSAETVQWSEELRTIVLTHPQAKIRDTLNTLILTQVVLLAFDDDIALGGDSEATILLMPVDGAGVQIVLNIKPSLLDGGTPTAEQYRVVFHEYVHIEQLFFSLLFLFLYPLWLFPLRQDFCKDIFSPFHQPGALFNQVVSTFASC